MLALLLLAGAAGAVRVRRHLRSTNSSTESQPLLAPDPSPVEELSDECRRIVLEKLSPVAQVESMECEEQKGFTKVAVEKLRLKDEKGTAAIITQSLQVCSGIRKDCAEQLSPNVVLKMRFAGLAVSQPCANEMNNAQMDQNRMAQSAVCEREGNYPQKTVEMLENRHMEGAIGVVEKGLTECVKITGQHCAWQIAPVIVSQIITAVKQQNQQMPLLMSPTVAAAVVVKTKTEKEFTPLSKLAVQPGLEEVLTVQPGLEEVLSK